ncbi:MULTISPECIES: hypothetical protein [unclassified Streptomyces]|uniref:hypothetical protein n=1 Tax=unclassified Streptomyces TaxID=2593676 RepID=UPI002E198130
MRTFLPAEFWWMFGEMLFASMVLILVAVVAADAVYRLFLRLRRSRRPRHERTPPRPELTGRRSG